MLINFLRYTKIKGGFKDNSDRVRIKRGKKLLDGLFSTTSTIMLHPIIYVDVSLLFTI